MTSTTFYAIGPSRKDDDVLEFKSYLEARINTVFDTMHEETEHVENEQGTRKINK